MTSAPPRRGGKRSARPCQYCGTLFAAKRRVKVFLGSDGAFGDGYGSSRSVRTEKPRTSVRGVVTVTASGVSGPQPDPCNARLVLYGANFNGAPCAVTTFGPWLPNTRFSASTLACATPSGGLYTGEMRLNPNSEKPPATFPQAAPTGDAKRGCAPSA